ncbi:hypothetical protein EHS25_000333 [Saitozyma podzolica]|uniref:Dipeptidyl aminopeptidase n=1 Tax=Saitozyma podzolica TaxID=1890683 RepID=A0A427YVX7_9TREE|nr:hypothetical protein EHS25_000333 [Saitozyma podzolica]
MSGSYSPVPRSTANAISLDSPAPSRRSLDSSSDGSDIVYRDALDDEPFDEKGSALRFDAEGRMEDGDDGAGYPVEPRRLRPRKKSRKVLAVLIGIVAFAAIIGALAATAYSAPSYSAKSGNRPITMDHIFNGTFGVESKSLEWVKEAPDGTFSHVNADGNIMLSTVQNMTEETLLVNSSRVKDSSGNQLHWQSWRLSADMDYVLFRTDTVKQWRHSSFGNFYVHRLSDDRTFPIHAVATKPTTSIAVWSPVGHSLAYVDNNDLFVITGDQLGGANPQSIRVTNDGSAAVFNGVPDWVYEEEVFETDKAVWWSPDGKALAYLRSDESAVKDYKLEYYNPTNDAFDVHQYPTELDMKYPKPGTPNPLVSVHTFSLSEYASSLSVTLARTELSWDGAMPLDSRIISEVGWVGDSALMIKEIDRAARRGSVVVFQDGEARGRIVRKLGKNGEEGDDGWIDHGQNVVPVKSPEGYLDIVPKEGYNHLAFFSPVDASEPVWLTSGDWEVTEISGMDETASTAHLYSAPIPTTSASGYEQNYQALTDVKQPGYHDVSFSPGGGYYVLQYRGPEVPWQRVMATDKELDFLLEGNSKLNATLSEFVRPIVTRTTLESDGYEFNMLEMLPPNIDTSGRKKYPVLIRVYGGPGSQMVSNKWDRDWHTFLVTNRKYIVIMLDGRGTGFKGRNMRNPVMDDLGHWEVVDQIAAAREAAKRRYVDTSRIGIWGWSYGGYMTCKTLEADSGIFTLGMAVAPVTNWLYYDSIYTERYMSTPTSNPQGYVLSAVNNVTAFNGVDFLLAHGSGDDNVHYLNTASLLDKFTQRHVRGWRFRMFTDSDHSMNKREAYRELYEWMTDYLDEKWGRGGTIHHA